MRWKNRTLDMRNAIKNVSSVKMFANLTGRAPVKTTRTTSTQFAPPAVGDGVADGQEDEGGAEVHGRDDIL